MCCGHQVRQWILRVNNVDLRKVLQHSGKKSKAKMGRWKFKGERGLKSQSMKLNWNFHPEGWGGGGSNQKPSMGRTWIFSGTTQYTHYFIAWHLWGTHTLQKGIAEAEEMHCCLFTIRHSGAFLSKLLQTLQFVHQTPQPQASMQELN